MIRHEIVPEIGPAFPGRMKVAVIVGERLRHPIGAPDAELLEIVPAAARGEVA